MHQVTVEEAQGQLPSLIDEISQGEEVIITQGSEPVAKLVPAGAGKRPGFGSLKGKIVIADDFDEPLADFKEYT